MDQATIDPESRLEEALRTRIDLQVCRDEIEVAPRLCATITAAHGLLDSLQAAVTDSDPDAASLRAHVQDVERLKRRVEAVELRLLAKASRKKVSEGTGHTSTGSWFSDTTKGDKRRSASDADLADARWRHLATRRHLEHAFVARFTPTDKPGVVKRTDESRQVESHAGISGLGAQIAVSSGREFTYTRRKEWSLGLEGFRKQVDYEFSTAEINVPVKEILGRAGWREALDSETKGALVMGAMGLSALVLVPLGLGINALVS